MKIHFGKRAAGGEAGLTQVKPKHKLSLIHISEPTRH